MAGDKVEVTISNEGEGSSGVSDGPAIYEKLPILCILENHWDKTSILI